MNFHTANAFDIVCRLDRDDILDEVPPNKKQKVASGLLFDKLRTQDFAGPLSGRATRVLGPISRHRIADILLHPHLLSAIFFAFSGSLLSQQVMDRLSSSASTASSIDSEHNMWNRLLELLFLKHVNDIFDSYTVEIDLAQIAFSCHFALDFLCYKEEVLNSVR